MKCHKCGIEIIDNYYCDRCITSVLEPNKNKNKKKKVNEAKAIHDFLFG